MRSSSSVPATMSGCLQAGEGKQLIHIPHSTLQQIYQTVYFFYSGHPSSRADSSDEEAHRSPSVHSLSMRHCVLERRENCCIIQIKDVTLSSSFELQSPWCDTPLQTELPSPSLLHPSQTHQTQNALEHITPKPEQEIMYSPHMGPLGYFGWDPVQHNTFGLA